MTIADILHKKQSKAEPVDWKKGYISAVEDLYGQIASILREAVDEGLAASKRSSKQLADEYLGTYSVDDLVLFVGAEQVRFSPGGMRINGSVGTVGVFGECGNVTLFAQHDRTWKIDTKNGEIPFGDSSFADILTAIMKPFP